MSEVIALQEASWSTADWALGAHPSAEGITFAVYAPSATRVQLEIYPRATGAVASDWFVLGKGEDGVWRGNLQGLQLNALYGFRVWGPNWPYDQEWTPGSETGFITDLDEEGNRFNPNKLLFDPYAREITHNVYSDELAKLGVNDGVFGTGGDDVNGVPRRSIDTAIYAPKGVVIADYTEVTSKPKIPGERSAIYEASVEQATGHPSAARLGDLLANEPGFDDVVNIPDEYRGTYKGVGMLAPYLKALGFTTIELLPVHQSNASESGRESKTNAWGYMTLGFFAPTRRYAHDKSWGGPTREFKAMVSAFHDIGLEIYLDVVYNHSAEGGNWGGDVNTVGFTSLGGFAAAEYYQMTDSKLLVDGATGTGNQLNYSSPVARQLVLDSLSYWTDDMRVDGFRFDLATVLGRLPDEAAPEDWGRQRRFFSDHPLLVGISEFAEANEIEVIAEAWDLWGYEVGNFPKGWGEWNGRYRDAVRRFTKGDGNALTFIDMFNGDYHHFHTSGGAQKTINLIDAHDGFNMADLVSYQEKNNDQPFPFGPSDGGSDDNLSWDSGGAQALRRQRVRNLWAVLFLSRGVPMVVAGDEFGRTQNGNNNPWELHSLAMCNNYAMIPTNAPQSVDVEAGVEATYHDNFGAFDTDPDVNALFRFATFVANLRQRHDALQQNHWGDLLADDEDVSYLFRTPSGAGNAKEGDRAVGVYINSPGDNFWVMINMADVPITFVAPELKDSVWRALINTDVSEEAHCNFWPEDEGPVRSDECEAPAWSVVVWQERATSVPGPTAMPAAPRKAELGPGPVPGTDQRRD